MSYTPKTWANGDTITAADLNHIEQGVSNAGGSDYDAVIEAYHDDGSTTWYNGWTLTYKKGNYAAIAAKLNSGTEAPMVLVKVKSLFHDLYGCFFALVNYYVPNVSVPFFNIHVDMVTNYSSTGSWAGTQYHLQLRCYADDSIEVL